MYWTISIDRKKTSQTNFVSVRRTFRHLTIKEKFDILSGFRWEVCHQIAGYKHYKEFIKPGMTILFVYNYMLRTQKLAENCFINIE